MTTRVRNQLRFENAVEQIQSTVQIRMETHIALLRGTSGLFAVGDRVTRRGFQNYVERLGLRDRYPGVQGIGFAVRVFANEIAPLADSLRAQGRTDFEIRPPLPRRPEYYPIIYLEPEDRRNQVAIGYDMFSEPVRRAAMEQARDQATAIASGQVTLVQEVSAQKQAGFLIYVPIYRGGTIPRTVAERRAALQGFVYSPFRAADLLTAIFESSPLLPVNYQIYDGNTTQPAHLLHQSARKQVAPAARMPRFRTVRSLTIAGRPWTLVVSSQPDLENADSDRAPLILLGGTLLSVLLFLLTRSQLQARDAVEASETRFRTLIEQAPLSVQILSPEGYTLQVNQAWEKLWDASLEQIRDYHLLSDRQLIEKGLMPDIERAFAGETVILDPVVYNPNQTIPGMTSRSMPERWVQTYIYPVKDSLGNIREVVLLHEDITKRRIAEQALQQSNQILQQQTQELMQANRMKDEFLSVLSHELRTPLNAMLGWARMLLTREVDRATSRRALETIERNTRSLAQMIEDILDVSKIITGKLRLNLEEIDLISTLETAIETIRPAAAAKEITLQTHLDPDVRYLYADAGRIQQVIWNLLSNAVKFTPSGGSVTVSMRKGEETGADGRVKSETPDQAAPSSVPPLACVEITVADNGQGISPEFLPYVFDRFRQADSSITRKFGGLGLGLSIVQQLVEMHGGTVRVFSSGQDQGSVFTVRLPMRAGVPAEFLPEARGSAPESLVKPPRSLQNLQILVVDDEADARELIALMLQGTEARVTAVASAGEALAFWQQHRQNQPIDLLISDIGMPEMDGYCLIQQIRSLEAQSPDIPALVAIALTAYARPEDQHRAIAAGFQYHLAKPIDPTTLIALIHQVLA